MKILALLMSMSLASVALAASVERTPVKQLLKNSYASQAVRIDDTTLRITARQRIAADLNEVLKPGTTMYDALQEVGNTAAIRAALETWQRNVRYFEVLGYRSTTQKIERRNASGGPTPERSFTWAPGHYFDDVELEIEVTIRLLPGTPPVGAEAAGATPAKIQDADDILKKAGLTIAPKVAAN
jgi:hypothetical protein